MTPPSAIEQWRETNPLCGQYAWYNVLMYFAAARAKELGYYRRIRRPRSKTCPVCGKSFREDSIPPSLVRHMGIDQIDICINCIGESLYQGSGSNRLGKPGIIRWIKNLTKELGVIPPQNLFESPASLTHLSTDDRVALVKLAKRRPTIARVKSLFGTWLKALIEAGVLRDGVRETSRGTHAVAKDGHLCLSLGEKTIDDYLFKHGIPHTKEPSYPESNYRADFKVGTHIVEYFGLAGDKDYDSKVDEKRQLARQNNINLVELFPRDLTSEGALAKKLRPAIRSLDA